MLLSFGEVLFLGLFVMLDQNYVRHVPVGLVSTKDVLECWLHSVDQFDQQMRVGGQGRI